MRVTLYSKPDCHLCDECKEYLRALTGAFALEVTVRNILDDDDDFNRFQYLIPVVAIEDGALLYPPHTLATLSAALLRVQEGAPHGAAAG